MALNRRPPVLVLTAILCCLACQRYTDTASAAPKGIFSDFVQCPASVAGVTLCEFAQTTGGEFKIGLMSVPVDRTLTLQAGGIESGKLNEYLLVPAANGETLSRTAINVPGGLLGLINCNLIKSRGPLDKAAKALCEGTANDPSLTVVTAITELVITKAHPAMFNLQNLVFGKGLALTLPIRVHLKNSLLGNSCYIGSTANPVLLQLTSGTSGPVPPNQGAEGSVGEFEELEEQGQFLDEVFDNSLVDSTYSSPEASGCGEFPSIIDPIVDAKLGLPSRSGHNVARLNGTLEAAEASAVLASEGF